MFANRLLPIIVAVVLVANFWWLGELFIAANGPTFDEAVHLTAGHSYLEKGDFRFNIEDPPLPKLWWALPGVLFGHDRFQPDPVDWERNDQWKMGNEFLYREPGSCDRLLTPARRMNLLFGVGIVLLVGWWSRRLWGGWLPAYFSASLAAFDPTLVAISGILSTDAAVTLFSFLACYFIWEYAAKPTNRVEDYSSSRAGGVSPPSISDEATPRGACAPRSDQETKNRNARIQFALMLAAGISLGLALGSKFSAVMIVAGIAAAVLAFVLLGGRFHEEAVGWKARWKSTLTPAVRITIVALVTLAACYAFIHFPDWGRGLKVQLTRAEHGDPHYVLLGDVRTSGSLWYFLVAIPLKLPLLTSGVFFISFLILPRDWRVDSRWPLVVVPPLIFLVMITISGVNLGVRVALPIFPFIWLIAGRYLSLNSGMFAMRLLSAALILILSVVTAYVVSPFSLSFMLGMTTTPAEKIAWLGDSNLDWGQGLPEIRKWMQKENVRHIYLGMHGEAPPRYFGIRHQRLPGYQIAPRSAVDHVPSRTPRHILMVSATHLQGIYLKPEHRLDWLKQRQPIATLAGGSVWVYDITTDTDARAKLRALALLK